MTEEKKDSKSKIIIILLIVIIVLLAGGGAAFILLGNNGTQADSNGSAVAQTQNENPLILKHEEGAMAIDNDSLQKIIDEMERTPPGYITLDYKNQVVSMDGENFDCYFGNAPENTQDLFFTLYEDDTFTDYIYLSGLISPGEGIYSFKSEKKLDPGYYDMILMFTQVDDTGTTMTSQTSVYVHVKVG